jgi:hypothetical protein
MDQQKAKFSFKETTVFQSFVSTGHSATKAIMTVAAHTKTCPAVFDENMRSAI